MRPAVATRTGERPLVSVRKSVPEPLRRAGRTAYVSTGKITSAWRAEPDFIVIGAQRCGTTSLFRALMEHPQIVRPTLHKGVNYFDLNYYRGRDWYRGHFPLTEVARRRTRRAGPPTIFEASGYYLYHPFAVERIARDLPEVKLVVMLRDPVERAYSAYQHERHRGFEWEEFETALALEDDRLVGEVARMRRDPGYESFSHRHHSYLHRGRYADQLRSVFEWFPADQVHVMASEAFFDEPAAEFDALMAFLDLAPAHHQKFAQYNAAPRAGMRETTRRELSDYYRGHDEALARLLGTELRWTQQTGAHS